MLHFGKLDFPLGINKLLDLYLKLVLDQAYQRAKVKE